jgi:hypothetical protein
MGESVQLLLFLCANKEMALPVRLFCILSAVHSESS